MSNPDPGRREVVSHLPDCDVCLQFKHNGTPARYVAKLRSGPHDHSPWAYVCTEHFLLYAIGLGPGRGQELVLDGDTA